MDLLPTMEKVLDRAGTVVDGVEPSELGNATPCTEWTVRAVINHVVGGATMFAECVEQGSVQDERLGQLMGGDNLGDDYKGARPCRIRPGDPRDQQRGRFGEDGQAALR